MFFVLSPDEMEKTNLESFISALLYEHDCVIIADFGGFVANYKSSFLQAEQQTLSPPSKKIAFNASLKINDGLLASYISENQSISYHQACSLISQYVEEAYSILETGRKLQLRDIGSLFYNSEKKIQFSPDSSANYLLDSFGLTTVHPGLIRRDTSIKKPEIKVHETPIKINPKPKKKRIVNLRWLELVPAAAVLTLLFLNPLVIKNINNNVAGLLPEIHVPAFLSGIVNEKQTEITPQVKINNLPVDTASSAVVPMTTDNHNITENISIDSSLNSKLSEEVPEKFTPLAKNPVTDNAATAKPIHSEIPSVSKVEPGRFYIIAGCFKIEENAINLYQELLTKGYPAQMIGKYKGLHVVTYQSEFDAIAAREVVSKLSQTGLEAWVLKK